MQRSWSSPPTLDGAGSTDVPGCTSETVEALLLADCTGSAASSPPQPVVAMTVTTIPVVHHRVRRQRCARRVAVDHRVDC